MVGDISRLFITYFSYTIQKDLLSFELFINILKILEYRNSFLLLCKIRKI